jgi:hypothetical protein
MTTKPNNNTSYLATQNPHPRDARIHFDEGPHTYTIQDIGGEFTSVTTWVHQHFEHFDAKKVIAAMMRNTKKWNDPVANAKYYGKTADEIEEMWANAGREAAAKGTEMHYNIECFYNTPSTDTRRGGADTPELKYFLAFHKDFAATLRPYRTEWTVFHEEARIAGSIDMVFEDASAATDNTPSYRRGGAEPPSEYRRGGAEPPSENRRGGAEPPSENRRGGAEPPLIIYDWKRCREITKTNAGNKFASHPAIEHLPDTNYWHYALQLNIYKYILQAKYGKTVTDLYLIVLHPEAPSYKRIKLPDLQAEVAELFEERIRRFAAD